MPQFQLNPGAHLNYYDSDFTDPWTTPEAVLMLHGSCENGRAWNAWIPKFARRFRVIRTDMRGFGNSTPMPAEYRWSFNALASDFERLMTSLGIERFHLIAAKLGGPIAQRLAASRPNRVRTLTLVGTPGSAEALGSPAEKEARSAKVQREGVAAWARETMKSRLGSACPPEMLEGWTQLMGATALSTHYGFSRYISGGVNIKPDLPRIACPTLVITSDNSKLGSVETTRSWQQQIRNSELFVFHGDSYHAAATHPDLCADTALAFIDKHSPT